MSENLKQELENAEQEGENLKLLVNKRVKLAT